MRPSRNPDQFSSISAEWLNKTLAVLRESQRLMMRFAIGENPKWYRLHRMSGGTAIEFKRRALAEMADAQDSDYFADISARPPFHVVVKIDADNNLVINIAHGTVCYTVQRYWGHDVELPSSAEATEELLKGEQLAYQWPSGDFDQLRIDLNWNEDYGIYRYNQVGTRLYDAYGESRGAPVWLGFDTGWALMFSIGGEYKIGKVDELTARTIDVVLTDFEWFHPKTYDATALLVRDYELERNNAERTGAFSAWFSGAVAQTAVATVSLVAERPSDSDGKMIVPVGATLFAVVENKFNAAKNKSVCEWVLSGEKGRNDNVEYPQFENVGDQLPLDVYPGKTFQKFSAIANFLTSAVIFPNVVNY